MAAQVLRRCARMLALALTTGLGMALVAPALHAQASGPAPSHAVNLDRLLDVLLAPPALTAGAIGAGRHFLPDLEFPFDCVPRRSDAWTEAAIECQAQVLVVRSDGPMQTAVLRVQHPVAGVRLAYLALEDDPAADALAGRLKHRLRQSCEPQLSYMSSPQAEGPKHSTGWLGEGPVLLAVHERWPAGGREELSLITVHPDAGGRWRKRAVDCEDLR